jgi:hypothetical protein
MDTKMTQAGALLKLPRIVNTFQSSMLNSFSNTTMCS